MTIVTLALLMSNVMAGLEATIINTALPSIVSDLQGIQYIGWIVAVYLLGMAVATPLWSKAGERIGNKRIYQISTLMFALGALFQGLSGNMLMFLIARAVMGIGAGGMNTIPFIIFAEMYEDPRVRSKIIGYASAGFSAASIVGPLIGGIIVDSFSWNWVFFINLPIAAISILCVRFFFVEPEMNGFSGRIDYAGAVTMIISLILILTGIQLVDIASTAVVIILIAVGIALLPVLFRIEARAEDPIIPNRLFGNITLMADFIFFSLMWGSFVAFNIYVPMWAQGILGFSALIGGATQIPSGFMNFTGAMSMGRVYSRIGKYPTIAVGISSFLLAFGILVFVDEATPLWVLMSAGFFEGLGIGISFNILQISVQLDAEKRDVPIATSFGFLLRMLSQTLMSAIYGVVLSHSILSGISNSASGITVSMMNDLSNAKSAVNIPVNLLPEMRGILYSGIHSIMMIAFFMLVGAMILNLAMQRRSQKKAVD